MERRAATPWRTRHAGANSSPDWREIVPRDGAEGKAISVITKRQWGAFYGTDLDLQLRRRGLTAIVLCGIAPSRRESTARDAYERGYQQVFVRDAMAGLNAESHANAIERIFPRIGPGCAARRKSSPLWRAGRAPAAVRRRPCRWVDHRASRGSSARRSPPAGDRRRRQAPSPAESPHHEFSRRTGSGQVCERRRSNRSDWRRAHQKSRSDAEASAPGAVDWTAKLCSNWGGNGVCRPADAGVKRPSSPTADDSSQILMEVRSAGTRNERTCPATSKP